MYRREFIRKTVIGAAGASAVGGKARAKEHRTSDGGQPRGEILIEIVSPQNDLPPIAFAVGDLLKVLEEAGTQPKLITEPVRPANRLCICVGLAEDPSAESFLAGTNQIVPAKAESYAIALKHQGMQSCVCVAGRDATGAMYGVFDVAEQIQWMQDDLDLSKIQGRTASPFLELRGCNLFLQTQAISDGGSWFHNDRFWQAHIDQLARSRHNFLDIHATYDYITSLIPSIYPYLFKLQEYPTIGVSEGEARRNLERLKSIVTAAKDRGIKVGLMSYSAGWYIPGSGGPYAHREFSVPWDIGSETPPLYWWISNLNVSPMANYRTGERSSEDQLGDYKDRPVKRYDNPLEPTDGELADYTAQCVKALMQEVPELAFVGFRVGESGKPTSFYQDSYLRGLQKAGATVNLYSRSWGAKRNDLELIASKYPGKMYVEIKYNGEFLVLPYQVTGGWMQNAGSYGYENYSDLSAGRLRVIWQVRASGEHRFFHWGDPEFVSRTLRACAFAKSVSYSVEPPTAYTPLSDFFTNANYYDNTYFQWLTERDWFWYELWGRLGYDPATPERVWVEEFKRRFGPDAGEHVYHMFVQSSRMVPLFTRMRQFVGDHAHFLPEMEWGQTIQDFASSYTCEVSSYVGISEYPDLLLAGEFTGRIKPQEVCRELEQISSESDRYATLAREANPKSIKEFDSLTRNIDALRALTDYYIHKIQAAIALGMARRTGATFYLQVLEQKSESYWNDWNRLVELTSKYYRPFAMAIRERGEYYHWSEELPKLEEERKFIRSFATQMRLRALKAHKPALAIIPVEDVPAGAPMEIRCNVVGGKRLEATTYYRTALRQDFQPLAMKSGGQPDLLMAIIDPRTLPGNGGVLEYYVQNGTTILPANAPAGLYRASYGEERFPPLIEIHPAQVDKSRGKARLSAKVTSPYGILWAKARYKPMPSTAKWMIADLVRSGDTYSVEIPMTDEGLQYCIEAVNGAGVGIVWPDVRRETPYVNVEGWMLG